MEIAAFGLLDAQIHSAFGVYGYPANEAGECLSHRFDHFHWSVNEKVSFELALGVSAAGYRAGVIIKQAGMNILYDPLVNAVVHGIGGGLVILSMDDIGCTKSTVEQDSRQLAQVAGVPVFDPSSAREVRDTIPYAFTLSETCSVPVLVRISSRLRSSSMTCREEGSVKKPLQTEHRVNKKIASHLSKIGRMQYYTEKKLPHIRSYMEAFYGEPTMDELTEGNVGVITCGGCCELLQELALPYQSLTASWPLPEKKILSFLKRYENILVIEEPNNFLENQLCALVHRYAIGTRILGRNHGMLPSNGFHSVERIRLVVEGLQQQEVILPHQREPAIRGKKPPETYPPLVHIYQELSQVTKEKDVRVAVDVGSSMSLMHPPYDIAEWGYCLGSPISVATGLARCGERAMAVIGDYAFIHSGIQSLMEAVDQQQDVMVIIIHDGISRRTGGQPHLLRARETNLTPSSMELFIRACGVTHVEIDSVTAKTPLATIREKMITLLKKKGVAVTVFTLFE